MKALILAAGIGKRLNSKEPKILLKIGQKTLLERYYQNLVNIDVNKIGLVVGFQKEKIEGLIKEIDKENRITIFRNTEFTKGSVISLVKASNFFEHQEEMILMDGDVLYHHDILQRLINSKKKNCFLLDRNIEEGEEPVKICIKKNHICDFGKKIKKDFDFCGESVGFFKFSYEVSKKLLVKAKEIMRSNSNEMYEEAIRLIVKDSVLNNFGYEDITNLPWIEIDFPEDLDKAKKKLLPKIDE